MAGGAVERCQDCGRHRGTVVLEGDLCGESEREEDGCQFEQSANDGPEGHFIDIINWEIGSDYSSRIHITIYQFKH